MPRMPAADAAGLIALLEGEGLAVWVDGGWAVDAVLGLQTRVHGDLDVALEERFVPVLRAALDARGFREVPRADTSPWNFVLGDGAGLEIDVHAFTFDEHGDGVYGPPENSDFYRAEALTGVGTIAGRGVRCISPAWLVRFRTGYAPRAVDRSDVAALCGRFGIEVPAAYRADPAEDVDRRAPRRRADSVLQGVPDAGGAMDLTIRPLTPDRWSALEDLFGGSGGSGGCWCMYWRIGPENRRRPRERNREALRERVQQGPPPGLLAYDGDRAVGWCQLTPRGELAWLERRREFVPLDDVPVWAVSCFYVRRGYRGHGVMAALIGEALCAARRAGAPALEAYPVDDAIAGATTNRFTGTLAAFLRAGFVEVARRSPARPVLRHDLAGVAP